MTQLLIDRATLEQLVAAAKYLTQIVLTNITDYPIETEQRITDWNTHQDAIASGRSALANAEPAGWQKIETAPKDGTSFMAGWFDGPSNPGCNMRPVKQYMGAWWESNEDYKVRTPTHWMPLPAAAKEQQ